MGEAISEDKFDSLCRLCATHDIIKMDIYGDKGRQRNLSDKISTCLPFEVSENDCLPKALCYQCIFHLETFFDFRRECIKAISLLEDFLRQSGKKISPCTRTEPPCLKIETSDPSLAENEMYSDWAGSKERNVIAGFNSPESLNPSDFLEACLGDSSPQSVTASDTNKPSESPGLGDGLDNTEKTTGSEVFKCKVCSRAFGSHASLILHSKFHGDGKKKSEVQEMYPCYVCDKVFGSKSHLAVHSRIHMSESHHLKQTRLYRCELCAKSFANSKQLWIHVSTTHRGHPLVTCEMCQRMFSSIANLHDHIRLKHKTSHQLSKQALAQKQIKEEIVDSPGGAGGSEYTDDDGKGEDRKSIDDGSAGNRRKMSRPRKIERDSELDSEGNKPTSQDDLGEYDPDAIKQEMIQDTQLSGDVIEPGEYVQSEMMDCEFAENMLESETVFCCEICIREFSDRGSLWLHMLYTHRDEASKACGLCLKIFSDNDALIQHVETCNPRGTERRRYSCTVCARQHDSRKKLVAHARIHQLTDEQGNPIDPESVVILNSSTYNTPGGFNHSAIDEGAAYQCTVCYKPFETEAKMIKHKASAHRENKTPNPYYFVCDICGLASSSRTDKWRHISTDHAGDPTVTCPQPQCNKVFATEGLKKDHCDSHHDIQGVYPSTCEVCGKLWNTRVEYWKHMMGVHPDLLPLVCGVCLKVFCNLSDLIHHVRDTHYPLSGGEHCCDLCGRPYSKLSKMSRHRKIHSTVPIPEDIRVLVENPVRNDRTEGSHFMDISGPPYTCEQCLDIENAAVCDSLEVLGAHRRDAHNSVPCDLCTKFYSTTSQLWKHVSRAHKGHPDVTCHICKRTSANRVILTAHVAKHRAQLQAREHSEEPDIPDSEDMEHVCSKCNKVFRKGSLMRKHQKHCKGPRAAPAVASLPPPVNGISTCAKCSKQFMSQNTLYKHMKSVHVIYNCELCEDSKHDSKTLLYQHIVEVHHDDHRLKCDFDGCDKILRTNSDMMKHRRTHNQLLTIYVCKFCAELLPSKMKMRKHMKLTHSSDSKYLCFVCMKAAASYKDLEEHVAESHGALLKRLNTCKVCGRTCSSKSKLVDHIKNHSPAFHPCRLCLKIFESPELLKEHVDNHPKEPVVEEEEVDDEEEEEIEEVELDESSIMDIIGASAGKGSVGSLPDSESVDSPDVDTNKTTDTSTTDDSKRKTDSEMEHSTCKKMKVEFSCVACDETFESRSRLLAHQEEEHDDVTCKKCGIVSSDIAEHNQHSKKCEEEEGREASQIIETMMTQDSVGSPSSPEDFETTNGEIITERLGRSKNPRKVYMDDLVPSACQICGKVWPAKKHLWQHLIRFHKTEACSTCGVCLSCFPDYKSLSAHLLSEHPSNYDGDGTNLTCRVCGKYHNARAKLHSHVSIHVGQEERALASSHMCLICNRIFPLFNKLSEHFFNIHKKEAEALKKVRVKKVAAVPGRRRRSNLKKVPDSKLPFYQCDICSLVFASEIGLTNHKWSHKNSDNFKCGQCGEVFPTVTGLKEHKNAKHPGKEYICAKCKCSFTTYTGLADHNKACSAKQKTLEQEIEEVESEDEENSVVIVKEDEDKSESSSKSDSDSSDSSDSSDDSSDSEDSDESGEDNSRQKNTKEQSTEEYTKCALSESSSSDDEEEPTSVTLAEGDIVEIVEVDANAPSAE